MKIDTSPLILSPIGAERKAFAYAFADQLVPQDPTDEPAGKLLERIRKQSGDQ